MELFATIFGGFLAWKLTILLLAGVVWPAFWIWMLIDAILRDTSSFQSHSTNEKLIWILVIAFLHMASIVYFFAIWQPAHRRATAARYIAPVVA